MSPDPSTRQYARLVEEWVTGIGLRREDYGTHSLPSFISRQATYAPYRFFSAIRKSRVPFGISASTSRMPWPSLKARKSNIWWLLGSAAGVEELIAKAGENRAQPGHSQC
jgi:hypothetical protein